MIIDQLPSITIANDSDEIAIEQGTATKKITKANLLKEINSDVDDLETIVGDGQLSGFTATDLTGAANELKSNLTEENTGRLADRPLVITTRNLTGTKSNYAGLASSNSKITSTMTSIKEVVNTPAEALSNIIWETVNGNINISGTFGTSGTTITFWLVEART